MLTALLALLAAAPPLAPCPSASAPSDFAHLGEQLRFRLDAMGAEVGTFEVGTEPAPAADRRRGPVEIRSHAKTSAFVSTNLGQYEAFATALLGPGLVPVQYKEEADEGQVHKS